MLLFAQPKSGMPLGLKLSNVAVGEQRRRVTTVAWNGHVLRVKKMLN
jgi:hypothetical protein